MNRKVIIGLIVAVIVVAGVTTLLAAHNSSDDSSSSTNTTSTSGSKSKDTTSTKPVATQTVAIQDMAFSPANITVKKGTTVTWTNHDSVAHTVTQTSGTNGPDSSSVKTGETYSFTYDTVGTFAYHCTIHPGMMGTVTVTE